MNGYIKLTIILIILLCIPLVQANATNPPSSIKIMGYLSSHNQIGIWWQNPTEFDYAGTQIWFNNTFIETTNSTANFKYFEFLPNGSHTFSTHTKDTSENINETWINITIENNGTCYEDWFYQGWCENPPTTSFTQNVSSGLYNLPVAFTDTSTGNATAWNWSFGDGTFSDLQNPIKEYSSGGNYTVTFTAWNTNATRTSSMSYVEVWNRTYNDFTANITSGNIPLVVQFTETSYNATSWYWMFGLSEGTSTDQNPIHTYIFDGVYTVNHSSSNEHHTYWTNKTYYITASAGGDVTPPDPITNLIATEDSCSQINWSWDNPGDNDLLYIQVWLDNVYIGNVSAPQNYYVTGSLTDNTSHTFSTRTIDTTGNMNPSWVNLTYEISACVGCPPLVVVFEADNTTVCAGDIVQFTDLTLNATSWNWNINGDFYDVKNPTYTFDPGTYTIKLTVGDGCSYANETRVDYITVTSCGNVTPTPTPTRVPGNVSQPQPPSKGAGNYTDIRIWAGLLIGSLVCMIITRNTKFNTLRPAIFGALSFILSIAAIWTSLSIAYLGNFALGATYRLTNQTTSTEYYYQVIQVVANTPTTVACIIIMIFIILNVIDIAMNYMMKSDEREAIDRENNRENLRMVNATRGKPK